MAKTADELETENGTLTAEVGRLRERHRGARRRVRQRVLGHIQVLMDEVRADQAAMGAAWADGALAALGRLQERTAKIDDRDEED